MYFVPSYIKIINVIAALVMIQTLCSEILQKVVFGSVVLVVTTILKIFIIIATTH